MNISFKRPEDVLPSTVILLAIVMMAGSLAFMLFTRPPTKAQLRKQEMHAVIQFADQKREMEKETSTANAESKGRIWSDDPQTVATSVLGKLTDDAAKDQVSVSSFRPQTMRPMSNETELPISVQVAGQYAGVRKLLHSLDGPDSRIALESVQIASEQNKAGGGITASLMVDAFMAELPSNELVTTAPVTITVKPARTLRTTGIGEKSTVDASPMASFKVTGRSLTASIGGQHG